MTRPSLPRSTDLTGPKRARQQFAVVPAYVILDRTITPAQKNVMQVICLHANQDGWAWPKLETMGEILGVQKPQVSKMIEALRQAGCIEVQYRTHDGKRKMFFRVIYDRPLETLEVAATEAGDEPELVSVEETNGAATGFHSGNDLFPSRKRDVSTTETPFFEHSSEQTKEQELPTPPAREAVGLEAEFTHEVHRRAYVELRAKHRSAVSLDAALQTVHQPVTGGAAFAWDVIGAGLVEQLGNGESFNLSRLRGYCRHVTAGPPAWAKSRTAPEAAPNASAVSYAGTQGFTPASFWDLVITAGLAAGMQSRDTLSERVQALHRDGRVSDPVQFLALVLHVKPWALTEIKFRKERDERLAAALASFTAPAAQEVA